VKLALFSGLKDAICANYGKKTHLAKTPDIWGLLYFGWKNKAFSSDFLKNMPNRHRRTRIAEKLFDIVSG